MARFFYFLLLVILARMAWSAVASWLAVQTHRQMGSNDRGSGGAPATIHKGLMVRDPVCGLHLPEHRAVTVVRAGETFHFCSERCRQRFVEAG